MTQDIIPDEIWKPVFGYEGLYDVSNTGLIKRLKRSVKQRNMYVEITRVHPELILSPYVDKDGYLATNLRKNTKRKAMKVHRAVALAFIPNPDNKEQVNHINLIKDDNRVENLEWATQSENHIHAYENGAHALNLHRDPVTGRNGYTGLQ